MPHSANPDHNPQKQMRKLQSALGDTQTLLTENYSKTGHSQTFKRVARSTPPRPDSALINKQKYVLTVHRRRHTPNKRIDFFKLILRNSANSPHVFMSHTNGSYHPVSYAWQTLTLYFYRGERIINH